MGSKFPWYPEVTGVKWKFRAWKQEKNSELDEDAYIVATRHIEEACAMKTILAAKYEPINITTVVNAQDHLTIPEKMALSKILSTRIKIFQVLLGSWKGKQIHLEFVPGAKPHACRPFPIPQIYKKLVKEEVQWLVKIGLVTKVEASEWSLPSFAIPKKNQTIWFVTDFRVLNTMLKRKPYPLLIIHEIIQTMGSFRYATYVDLNMGYYSMELDEESKKRRVTCMLLGLYAYNMLPMGIKVATDVFQEAMGVFLRIWNK